MQAGSATAHRTPARAVLPGRTEEKPPKRLFSATPSCGRKAPRGVAADEARNLWSPMAGVNTPLFRGQIHPGLAFRGAARRGRHNRGVSFEAPVALVPLVAASFQLAECDNKASSQGVGHGSGLPMPRRRTFAQALQAILFGTGSALLSYVATRLHLVGLGAALGKLKTCPHGREACPVPNRIGRMPFSRVHVPSRHTNASAVSAGAGPYFSGAIVKLARPWLTLRTAAE